MSVETRMFDLLHRICEHFDEGTEPLTHSTQLFGSEPNVRQFQTVHQELNDLLDDAVNAGYDFDHNGRGIKKPARTT